MHLFDRINEEFAKQDVDQSKIKFWRNELHRLELEERYKYNYLRSQLKTNEFLFTGLKKKE